MGYAGLRQEPGHLVAAQMAAHGIFPTKPAQQFGERLLAIAVVGVVVDQHLLVVTEMEIADNDGKDSLTQFA